MIKNILLSIAVIAGLVSCNEDYNDWTSPQSNAQNDPMAVVDVNVAVKPLDIVMDEQTSDSVEILTLTTGSGVSSNISDYVVNFVNPEMPDTAIGLKPSATGMVAVEDIDTIALTYYGKESTARTLKAFAEGTATVTSAEGVISVPVVSDTVTIIVTPHAPKYADVIYYVGTTGGWDAANANTQKLGITDANTGVYEGFIYQTELGYGNTFKFLQTLGDWGSEINSSFFTTFSGDVAPHDGDTNLMATQGTGLYYVKLDLTEKELTLTLISSVGVVGCDAGWDNDRFGVWDADNFYYTFTNAAVDDSNWGWKFRFNGGWDLSLGTDISNLIFNGGNLTAAGSTVKLYPCRTTSKNIYATVE